MDQTAPQPEVIISQSSWPKKKLIVLGILILLAVILFSLNYLKIIKFKTSSTPKQSAQIPSPPAKPKVTFACPVPKESCQTAKAVNYQGNPALIFNIPGGKEITSSTKVIDSRQFVEQPYKKGNPIGFYQSILLGNSCYTLTYTFPSDTKLAKIELLPVPSGAIIATTSANFLTVYNQPASLILQLQKRQVISQAGKQDYEICSVTNLKTSDFGQYQQLDIYSLK